MPCNSLLVAPGQVVTDLARDILGSAQAIEAVRALIAQLLGIDPAAVTVHDTQAFDWAQGWSQWTRTRRVNQAVPVADLAGAPVLLWVADALAVRLTADGTLSYRDGWDLSQATRDTSREAFKAQFEALMQQLAVALAQESIVQAVGQVAPVVSDQWVGSARVLKVRI